MSTDTEAPATEPNPVPVRSRYRRRRRTRAAVGTGIAVVVVGAAAVAAFGFGGAEAQTPVANRLPPATGKVTRTTLTQTQNVSGTLGYGDTHVITARSSGLPTGSGSGTATGGGAAGGSTGNGSPGGGSAAGSGSAGTGSAGNGSGGTAAAGSTNTLTWLPGIGATVSRGQPVYRVDDRPVVLLNGTIPLYRVLQPGLTGADVKQFEQNLSALGYGGFTVDDQYTSATASAVRNWQEALGLPRTGTVDLNQAVVAPGVLRVAALNTTLGSPASGAILTYTGVTRVVTIALDVSMQQLVKKDIPATITLPDGRTVAGTVASVGTVASRATSGSGAQQSSSTTIAVVVGIADQAALGALDEAPVDVTLVASQRQDVLTVPVGALVALAEGGYGVQVVEGSTTRYVAVKTGMFAGGRVEISGDTIAEGTVVGVPK